MAKIRTIDPDIWKHKAFLNAPWHCREVFMYLFTVAADDEGRFEWEPAMILENAFPRSYPVTLDDVAADMDLLTETALVVRYGANSEYGFLTGWYEHQYIKSDRRTPSGKQAPPVDINSWEKADKLRGIFASAMGIKLVNATFHDAVEWYSGEVKSGNDLLPNLLHSGNAAEPIRNQSGNTSEPDRYQTGTETETLWNHSGTSPVPVRQPEVEREGEREVESKGLARAKLAPPELSTKLSTNDQKPPPHVAFAEKLWTEFRQALPCPKPVVTAAGQFLKSHGQRGADLLLVAFASTTDGLLVPEGADPATHIADRVRTAIRRDFEWDPNKQRGQPQRITPTTTPVEKMTTGRVKI